MTMPKGRWVPCTPEWVAEWKSCGATVRRPIIEVCDIDTPRMGGSPHFHTTGHEHLMVVFQYSGHMSPMPHESGEPT